MPGMGAPAGAPAGFPALAVIVALFLLGHVVWTTDQLAALARVTTSPAAPAWPPQQRELVTVPAADHPARLPVLPAPPNPLGPRSWPRRQTATDGPKLAACGKITMSIAMGYMVILML